uniref:Globin n=1 Tax=Macrostomum lignano TaxID=282301 RepID=A0A1I8FTJ4_9PLAT
MSGNGARAFRELFASGPENFG